MSRRRKSKHETGNQIPTQDNPDPVLNNDTLSLILNKLSQLSGIASDIKDIKKAQSQFSTDIAHCRTLLQQHSESIARHEDQLANYEASIQNILSTQATLSTNIANIESRFSSSTVNAVVPNQASPPGGRITQTETLELLRRSHNILKGIVEGNNYESIVHSL
nr:unnamed protein product [Callosobruchus analis]